DTGYRIQDSGGRQLRNGMERRFAKHGWRMAKLATLATSLTLLTASCLLPPASWPLPTASLSQLIASSSDQPAASRQLATDNWREAEAGYRYEFPRDHAAHEDYAIEWWYYTGNLRAGDGRQFGYQLTFFRIVITR